MGYNMVININKKSVDETPADGSTPAQRQLKSRLISSRQKPIGLQNGLDKIIEVKEDDEKDEIDEEEDADEENEDDEEVEEDDDEKEEDHYNEEEYGDEDEEDGGDEKEDGGSEEEGGEDGKDDKNFEYEEDFADADTEWSDSDDSQATYLPSALNSEGDSSEEAGSGNEDEALSLMNEFGYLGISPDESNK
jgi:hypothetical protein